MTRFTVLPLLSCLLFPAALPAGENPELKPYARLDTRLARESSAFLKSPSLKNVYWTLNDSNNTPAIFAFTRDGKPVKPAGVKDADYLGITVSGATNVDWEGMAADGKGNLIVADSGNNRSRRKDLAVYIFPEPDPARVQVSSPAVKVGFRYPDQTGFPDRSSNFDSESVFWAEGRLYLITKHRSDTRAKLYRFNELKAGTVETLALVSSFDALSMTTDAAVTPDGGKLALLTYEGAWLFEKPAGSDDYFSGKRRRFVFSAGQCEGLTFDGNDTLVISNEEKELFEVKVSSFTGG